MEQIEKEISNLIEHQFPAFYRTDGPVFVEFVKKYYEWMETSSPTANSRLMTKGSVSVNAQSATVHGRNTNFELNFIDGDQIAISQDSNPDNYSLFTINTVSNGTLITLAANTVPDFSSTNSTYYVVTNQKNPNYYARRLLENKDIDATAEEFIVYFKEKYLKNIQFTTQTNTRLLLKRVLDLYRSKGTERSVDLLFKIVFGVPASVYYPGEDVFRLSDGQWHRPKYIEVSLKNTNIEMVNKQVMGVSSGATAFVEAVVRKTVRNRFIDVLYISAINGNFQTGELLSCPSSSLTKHQLPTMIGSLTSITVDADSTGYGYEIGDIIDFESASGESAYARVTEVANTEGTADIELINGGYAYTANANVFISEKVLIVANCQTLAGYYANSFVDFFDTFSQPLAIVTMNQGTGTYIAGSNVFTYHANNLQQGFGRVVNYLGNTSVGNATVAVFTGTFNSTHLYTTGNVISANILTYTDDSQTANLFAAASNVELTVSNTSGTFTAAEFIYQRHPITSAIVATGTLKLYSTQVGSNGIVSLTNVAGVFKTSQPVYGNTSGANTYVNNFKLYLGVKGISSDFISSDYNHVTWANGQVNGTIDIISSGNGADFDVSANLLYEETISLNSNYILPYAAVVLGAALYGFPAYPAGNAINTPIANLLSYSSVNVGKIQYLTNINQGLNYDLPPFIRIYEPWTANYRKPEYYRLTTTGASGSFANGEVVTQSATSGRGLIVQSNSSYMILEKLRFLDANDIIVTSNSTTTLVGSLTGITCNVVTVEITGNNVLGYNANVAAPVVAGNGAIVSLEVLDSGFGFRQDEAMTITSETQSLEISANLGSYGQGTGFYRQKGGELSNQKKLFDGLYYQDYSYEIRSSITLDRYEDMLKQLLHISGTKYFGAFIYTSIANATISAQSTVISANNNQAGMLDFDIINNSGYVTII